VTNKDPTPSRDTDIVCILTVNAPTSFDTKTIVKKVRPQILRAVPNEVFVKGMKVVSVNTF
jgi:hypothetical protein